MHLPSMEAHLPILWRIVANAHVLKTFSPCGGSTSILMRRNGEYNAFQTDRGNTSRRNQDLNLPRIQTDRMLLDMI